MDLQYEVIIIGAGPAGLTAAIYASRANLKTCIIEAEAPGGKLVKTYQIENYPGIKKMAGVDLAISLMEHGMSFGAEMQTGKVSKITCEGNNRVVEMSDGRRFTGKAVIIASGTKERELDVPRAKEFTGRGISYCAVCDGAFYREKEVTVIGGGNSALEESIYLTGLVKKVNIVIRRDVFRAEAAIQKQVMENEKINVIVKHVPDSLIIEDNKIAGVNIKNVETGEITPLPCSGIFPYIGADPSTDFADSSILNEKGYIVADKDMSTAIPGIFAAGDVIDKQLRQVVTATSDGAIAADSAIRYIKNSDK